MPYKRLSLPKEPALTGATAPFFFHPGKTHPRLGALQRGLRSQREGGTRQAEDLVASHRGKRGEKVGRKRRERAREWQSVPNGFYLPAHNHGDVGGAQKCTREEGGGGVPCMRVEPKRALNSLFLEHARGGNAWTSSARPPFPPLHILCPGWPQQFLRAQCPCAEMTHGPVTSRESGARGPSRTQIHARTLTLSHTHAHSHKAPRGRESRGNQTRPFFFLKNKTKHKPTRDQEARCPHPPFFHSA